MRTPPGNLTSMTTAKSMTGMPAGTPLWRAGWTAWKKRGRGKKSSMTFSAASLRGLARQKSCRWISTRSCSTGLWITQRSIRTAGWCSPSATGWKPARRFKAGSGRGIGFLTDASADFSVRGNRVLLCMEICEELRYNLDVGGDQRIRICRKLIWLILLLICLRRLLISLSLFG